MRFLRLTVALATALAVPALSLPARAGPLEVDGQRQHMVLKRKSDQRKYLRIKPGELLKLRVEGPNNLGLRCRELWIGKEAVPPVYLTVVRDQKEQGTVRFVLPAPDGAGIPARPEMQVSGEVLVKIEVPRGTHGYQLLVSGPREGILVQPFLGLRARDKVIVATPGVVEEPPPAEKKPAPMKKQPPVLLAPPVDILEPVALAPGEEIAEVVRHTVIRHRPGGIGPGTRTSGTLAAMFLLGGASLFISGAAQEQRAADEPVQIPAGEYLDRSDKTYQAAYVLTGLGAAALMATLVFYLVEEPAPGISAAPGGVEVRF
jgi:hypothetical protein